MIDLFRNFLTKFEKFSDFLTDLAYFFAEFWNLLREFILKFITLVSFFSIFACLILFIYYGIYGNAYLEGAFYIASIPILVFLNKSTRG